MNYPTKIKTIKRQSEYNLKEKKSHFRGILFPVSDSVDAERTIKRIKKKYPDASHHCYAFKLANGTYKSSDAGEPAGTAGTKILGAIEHFDLMNLLVMVIRYFGGIKLGIGPLARAYYFTAIRAMEENEIILKELYQRMRIEANFEHSGIVYNILAAFDAKTEKADYRNKIEITCSVKTQNSHHICRELRENSRGSIEYNLLEEYLYL